MGKIFEIPMSSLGNVHLISGIAHCYHLFIFTKFGAKLTSDIDPLIKS